MSYSTYSLYKKLFIGNNAIVYRKDELYGWQPYYRATFSNNLLKCHLRGDIILGQQTSNENYINKFILDFDYHNIISRELWESNILDLVSSINAPYISVTSSDKDNYHFYFYIEPTDPYIVKNKLVNLVNQCLTSKDFGGGIDIFCSNYTLRLPFGNGSYPVVVKNNKLVKVIDKIKYFNENFNKILKIVKPSIYHTIQDNYIISKVKRDDYNIEIDEYKINLLLNSGITDLGTMNSSCLILTRYFFSLTNDLEVTKYKLKTWVLSFPHHYSLSKDLSNNKDKFFKKLDKMVDNWVTKIGFINCNFKEIRIPEEVCYEIYRLFSYSVNLQYKVFNLFKFIYYATNNKHKAFFMSVKLLNNKKYKIQLNLHRQEVLRKLIDNNLISFITWGSNFKKHPNMYKYIGPLVTQNNRTYSDYTKYLLDKKLYLSYSKYYQHKFKYDKEI